MKIVYMGTPDFAVAPLAALVENGYEVEAVITQPDKPKGRGKTMMPTPVKEEALKHEIPVLQPVKVREEAIISAARIVTNVAFFTIFYSFYPKTPVVLPNQVYHRRLILSMPKSGAKSKTTSIAAPTVRRAISRAPRRRRRGILPQSGCWMRTGGCPSSEPSLSTPPGCGWKLRCYRLHRLGK